jgi:hypothetical protein
VIQGSPTGYFKYTISGGKGMSGGPYFYCPTANGCTGGAWITGVQHGFSYTPGGSSWFEGPKSSDIRDWVINNTP